MNEDHRRIEEIQDELADLENRQKALEKELDMLMMKLGGFDNVIRQLKPKVRNALALEGVSTDIQLVNFVEGNWNTHLLRYAKASTPIERVCSLRNVGPKNATEAMLVINQLLD